MVVKKIFLLITLVVFSFNAFANTPRSTGKYKNWESFVAETEKGKICFAQTIPTKRAPGAIQRDQSKLFVTFRPGENIKDEVSVTSGHDYKSSTVTASSGKKRYSFFSQKNFAWLLDDQEERNFIKLMKRATNLIVKARTTKGAETTDHYSMMGFTKAYNTAKKTCGQMKKIVLAYSGGLDTSIILRWLQGDYNAEAIAQASGSGQEIDRKKIITNA